MVGGGRYVVLDEADTMFDQGFGAEVRQVLKPVRQKEEPCKVVLVTATLTKVRIVGTQGWRVRERGEFGRRGGWCWLGLMREDVGVQEVRKLLDSEFPNMKRVDTSSLHRTTATARHDFHSTPPGRDKLGYLHELLQPPVNKV
jgi:energy-coupling factor transporter ATP-binding protein EcfA2